MNVMQMCCFHWDDLVGNNVKRIFNVFITTVSGIKLKIMTSLLLVVPNKESVHKNYCVTPLRVKVFY